MTKYYAIFLVDISGVCEPTYVRVDFKSDQPLKRNLLFEPAENSLIEAARTIKPLQRYRKNTDGSTSPFIDCKVFANHVARYRLRSVHKVSDDE